MRTPILLTLALLGLAPGASAATAEAPVLVELFTSEGCSSCPPADELLGRLAGRADVLPLAFHVTYWDQLGWPDSFGDRRFVARQRDYARLLGTGSVYTPEMVVAGRIDVVGSDGPAAAAAIGSARSGDQAAAAILFRDHGHAELPGLPLDRPATLWLAAFDEHQRVAVARGENAGRTLDHYNVVREFDELGPWDGRPRTVELPADRLARDHRAGLALVAQDPATGRVLAIGRLRL